MFKYVLILTLYICLELSAQGGIDIPEVLVTGGSFDMGCTVEQEIDCRENEYPIKQVRVESFYMSKYEVTQELWKQIMGNNPSNFRPSDPRGKACKKCPVESVNWFDVKHFIEKLNQKTSKNYRLPTESEWEYAARGGDKSRYTRFSGGENLKVLGWYYQNSHNKTHPVGSKKPNELGLYDMSGNIWEWCSNTYKGKAVVRGGSWVSYFWDTRTSVTDLLEKKKQRIDVGFRLARSK